MVPAKLSDYGLLLDRYVEELEENYNVSSTQENPLCLKYIKSNPYCQDNRTGKAKHITSRIFKECNMILLHLFPACKLTYFSFNI